MTSAAFALVQAHKVPSTALAIPARPQRRAFGSRNNFGVALFALTIFVLVATVLMRNGYVSDDIDALLTRDAGRHGGGWLAEVVLFLVRALPADWARQTALVALVAGSAGLMFGVLYHNVRDSDWSAAGATLLLVLLGGQALLLYPITSAGLVLPTLIALGALIPAIRRLESVGDVQADVSFGLVLPLLLLAGPATTLLIVPLAVASALANPDGRSHRAAFVAMLLVAVMPTLIVIVAVFGFGIAAGIDPAELILPYARAFASVRFSGLGEGLADLLVVMPLGAIPVVYCFFKDRRRRPVSALAVVGLPLYLALGNAVFPWNLPAWTPAAALLGCFATWLAVARLRAPFRIAALVLLAVSAAASWLLPAVINDPAWIEALTAGI